MINNHISKFKSIISNLLSKNEKYLVIEVLNHYIQITALKVDSKNKKITVFKNFFQPIPEFTIANILNIFPALFKKISKPGKYKIIISLDSRLGTTLYSSISLVRSNPKEVIDEADLDNLISQAIWRFFDKNRWRIAKKMEIDEVDVLLSDVRIRDLRIDGHRVVNPLGFKAKSVEIIFSQTLVGRELMRAVKDLIPKENITLITEAGTALSHVFSRVLEEENFYLANLFPGHTSVFSVAGLRLAHHDGFDWGGDNLIHFLRRQFCLDPDTADSLIQNYVAGNASQGFLRRFENILVKELYGFSNGIESLLPDEQSAVYLNSFFTVPPIVYSGRFQNRFKKPIKLFPLSPEIITAKLGYTVQFKSRIPVRNQLSLLGAILEVKFLPANNTLSHLANRRLRWLVS